MLTPRHSLLGRFRPLSALRGVAATAAGAVLVLGLAPAVPAQAASSGTLPLAASGEAMAKIGSKRTTAVVESTFTVPAASPVDVAVQLRASKKTYGYRAGLTFGSDGSVKGSFTRVRAGVSTTISSPTDLGFSVAAGDRVHLEATVAAKRVVKLYLRAWKEGSAKPSSWQLYATDSSKQRLHSSGYAYVWAKDGTNQANQLPFTVVSVKSYTAKKAAAVGVTTPGGGGGGTETSGDDSFAVAVIGDTQNEVMSSTDTRLSKRTAWLATNKDSLNLKYVLQTGDLANYAWLDTAEYTRAKAALSSITTGGLLYNGAIGNHDTAAVGWNGVSGSTGYGGSAYAQNPECPGKLGAAACNSNLLVRKTDVFNSFFPLSEIKNVGGAFEAGKSDNVWTTFEAGNSTWLVLTIEFTPRKTAVEWARKVVAAHPEANVIIQTHYYLDGDGSISGSNAGYGETSGQYIRDQIVSKYSNVKLVFSGHVGAYTNRADSYSGNTVVSYLGDEISGSAPLRTVTINPATGAVNTTVYDGSLKPVDTTSNAIQVIRH